MIDSLESSCLKLWEMLYVVQVAARPCRARQVLRKGRMRCYLVGDGVRGT